MKFEVALTPSFRKQLKHIAKKHRGILADITVLINQLAQNPNKGVDLGKSIYKIRLPITGTSKGKSGGARVITFVKVSASTVILAEIYLKNEYDTVDVDSVVSRLFDEGFI